MIFLKNILSFFFPYLCAFCGEVVAEDGEICASCTEDMYLVGDSPCMSCGRDKEQCGCARGEVKFFEKCIAPFYYSHVIQSGIQQFKFSGRDDLARVFAKFMYDRLCEFEMQGAFDVIVFVPIHKTRRQKRGYNQAELLARCLSDWFSVPLLGDVLIKKKTTFSQRELGAKERRENVKDTILWKDSKERVDGKRILLVDDVFTTGATVGECASVLKKAGASEIVVSVIAVTRRL